ncbi:MAG TPA: RdgB/HAM1 family non-canonical purine NTP pyrophosphatase [Candidatus Methylomirabilis sp.]|nr:RdgB/HAM1 family non-canonical purine NTP pyrophosphatase [Candidatus Methylomirabilis sp.]
MREPVKLFLASSNPGKVGEFRALAAKCASPLDVTIELLPGFEGLAAFEEKGPTIAENATGKALHYSRLMSGLVFADDSGLVVPALGGAPGVHSARYAGVGASNEERIAKLLAELRGKRGKERAAHFVCAIALAAGGRAMAVVTDRADGEILEAPRGNGGFGYDPVFYFAPLKKTFAELFMEEKNEFSHRGKAFRKLLTAIGSL